MILLKQRSKKTAKYNGTLGGARQVKLYAIQSLLKILPRPCDLAKSFQAMVPQASHANKVDTKDNHNVRLERRTGVTRQARNRVAASVLSLHFSPI